MKKIKVGFICVHNSCRSQIAEALANKYASDYIEAYSAGTEIDRSINKDAIRIVKDLHGINMEEKQKVKLLSDIPDMDMIITMGCNVECPILPYKYLVEDWGLEDPTGKDDIEFKKVINEINNKIEDLVLKIKNKY